MDNTKKFEFSKNKNVVVIILDSFPTDVFQEIINKRRELAKELDGFTYFRNSLGGYPFTELSVALILTGKYYDNSLPFEDWKRDAYMSASIPRVLTSAGWQVDVYPKVSYSLYYSDDIASNLIKGVPIAEKMFNMAGSTRPDPVPLPAPFHQTPGVQRSGVAVQEIRHEAHRERYQDRKIHTMRVTGLKSEKRLYRKHFFPRKALRNSANLHFVAQMLSKSATADTKGTFKFYHLDIPPADIARRKFQLSICGG